VTGKVKVTSAGMPVAAEVAVAVADEGVLKLIDWKTPNPMKTFYAAWMHSVTAASNIMSIMRRIDPNTGNPDEGGDFASSNDQQKVRTKFLATAFWAPSLVTDSNGEATFTFTAPDNLTTFRVMATAADAGAKFGAGELPLLVTKPIVIDPVLSRFVRAGDNATIGVMINNRTAKAGTANITMSATGLTLGQASGSVVVPANGKARLDFAVTALDVEQAAVTFTAILNGDKDAMTVNVPIVRTPVIEQRLEAAVALDASTPFTKTIVADPNARIDQSHVTITLDRTGLGDLEPSLRYLVEYPYGCLEQTMSRMVPLVAARELSQSLGGDLVHNDKATSYVKIAVAKLARHQHEDGMFSLWPNSQTYPHLTAYAIWALDQAERGGAKIPAGVVNRGIDALDAWAASADTGQLVNAEHGGALAMATYVAAVRGKPLAAVMGRLYENRALLPQYGRSFLWRAMAKAKAPTSQIADIRQLVMGGIKVAGASASVQEANPSYDHMHSNARATAMALDAFVELAPKDPMTQQLATGLLAQRNSTGAWDNTQENLWSIIALANFAKRTSAGSAKAAITIGGKPFATPTLQGATIATIRVPMQTIISEELTIRSDTRINATIRSASTMKKPLGAATNGFTISRRYLDEKGNAVNAVRAGDIITVSVKVSSADSQSWVAIADMLPAGFEPLNPKLSSGASKHQDDDADDGDYDSWFVTYAELRDDRALWFIDRLDAGEHEVSYRVRATMAGVFTAPAATVEAMYQPTKNARTDVTTVNIGSSTTSIATTGKQ
jgi:alpha-2-macroglobulin